MSIRDLPRDPAHRPIPSGTPVTYFPRGLPAAAGRTILETQSEAPRPPAKDSSGPTKTVSIVPEHEPDSARRVTLEPGTTAGEAKALAGLPKDFSLRSPKHGSFFADDEDLYPMVEDGDKIFATPPFTAGSVLARLKELVIAVASRDTDDQWLRAAGWKKVGSAYQGRFRMGSAEPIRGRIELGAGLPQVYFWRLPPLLAEHICIEKKGDSDWYWLHPERPPTTTSPRAVIAEVELFLQTLANPRLWRRGVA